MTFSKSKGIIALSTMVISIALLGCGDSEESKAAVSEDNNVNVEEIEEVEDSKVITDGLDREVEIPANPEKIVSLNNVGELLALGVEPVGTSDYYLDKFSEEEVSDIISVGGDEPSIEKIVELAPDLIIISSYQEDSLELLEKIAPTVATPWGLPAKEQLNFVADMLGLEEEEEAWHTKYGEKVEEVKAELEPHVEKGASAVVLQFYDKVIYQSSTDVFSALYEGAGFEATEQAAEVTETASISEEAIPEFAESADYIFILVEDPSDETRYEELKDSVWANLEAVENDQVILVESKKWNDYNVTTMEWQLDDIVEQIAK